MGGFFTVIRQALSNDTVRYVGGVAGFAATLSSVIFFTLGGLNDGAAPPVYQRAILALAATAAVFLIVGIIGIGSSIFLWKRASRFDAFEAKMLAVLAEFNQALATDYLFCRFLDKERLTADFDPEYVRGEFHRYVEDFLDHVSKIFSLYTGKACAASIKIFSESKTDKIEIDLDQDEDSSRVYVFTLGRDKGSSHSRSYVDADESPLAVYRYSYNTAFRRITHDPELCGYFVGERLSKRSAEEYANAHPDWWKHYDAVAVASLKNPNKKAVEQALGFLCVDSKDVGFEDNGTSRELLESLASIAYYSIRKTISLVRNRTRQEAEGEL